MNIQPALLPIVQQKRVSTYAKRKKFFSIFDQIRPCKSVRVRNLPQRDKFLKSFVRVFNHVMAAPSLERIISCLHGQKCHLLTFWALQDAPSTCSLKSISISIDFVKKISFFELKSWIFSRLLRVTYLIYLFFLISLLQKFEIFFKTRPHRAFVKVSYDKTKDKGSVKSNFKEVVEGVAKILRKTSTCNSETQGESELRFDQKFR